MTHSNSNPKNAPPKCALKKLFGIMKKQRN
jgi:hypothetical protein